MKIKIYYDNINYRLRESKKGLKLIEKVIRKENKVPGDLNFIITDDNALKELNKEFLNRNTLTDVIAFDYSVKRIIDGEIYISHERVKRNALNYKVSLKSEMIRVMVHGTLHLCGYNDKNKKEKKIMEIKEDEWLKKIEIDK